MTSEESWFDRPAPPAVLVYRCSITQINAEESPIDAILTPTPAGHVLKNELRLRDLVQMQILLVVGVTWIGTAAKQGGTYLVQWIAAIATLFLPSAAVVSTVCRYAPRKAAYTSGHDMSSARSSEGRCFDLRGCASRQPLAW